MLSLLTPEYQKRMVQGIYHESVTNAPQWNASFCYPEGLVRFYTQFAVQQPMEVMMTPNQVQFLSGIADNFLFKVLIGRNHAQKTPQWYGETVGFWDGDKLITWTANVQGWTITHALFEYSNRLETIEIITPRQDANGAFAGLTIETIFYDPEAFVAPLRSTMRWNRTQRHDSPTLRHTFIECLSNVVNVNGRPTPAVAERSPLRRLLRPPLGEELGEVLRAGSREAGRRAAGRDARYLQVDRLLLLAAPALGSSRAARRPAGMLARSIAAASNAADPPSAAISTPGTPNTSARMTSPAAMPMRPPSTAPIVATVRACRRTIATTRSARAPRAIRTAISRRRIATL